MVDLKQSLFSAKMKTWWRKIHMGLAMIKDVLSHLISSIPFYWDANRSEILLVSQLLVFMMLSCIITNACSYYVFIIIQGVYDEPVETSLVHKVLAVEVHCYWLN